MSSLEPLVGCWLEKTARISYWLYHPELSVQVRYVVMEWTYQVAE